MKTGWKPLSKWSIQNSVSVVGHWTGIFYQIRMFTHRAYFNKILFSHNGFRTLLTSKTNEMISIMNFPDLLNQRFHNLVFQRNVTPADWLLVFFNDVKDFYIWANKHALNQIRSEATLMSRNIKDLQKPSARLNFF